VQFLAQNVPEFLGGGVRPQTALVTVGPYAISGTCFDVEGFPEAQLYVQVPATGTTVFQRNGVGGQNDMPGSTTFDIGGAYIAAGANVSLVSTQTPPAFAYDREAGTLIVNNTTMDGLTIEYSIIADFRGAPNNKVCDFFGSAYLTS
jgi:hypothetical protein